MAIMYQCPTYAVIYRHSVICTLVNLILRVRIRIHGTICGIICISCIICTICKPHAETRAVFEYRVRLV